MSPPLTARLPTVPEKQKFRQSLQDADQPVTLGLLGPVYDQAQKPEKQRLERCLFEEIEDNGLALQPLPQGGGEFATQSVDELAAGRHCCVGGSRATDQDHR